MRATKIFSFLIIMFFFSCSQLEKAEELITGLSEKEKYKKNYDISDELFKIWENRITTALDDSLEIDLPYLETGELKPRNFAIYSYASYLIPGEVLEAEIVTDSSSTLIFSDLYKETDSENKEFKKITSGEAQTRNLSFEIKEKGLYKIVIQPEIEANTPFQIRIKKSPAYLFPVLNGANADIGSYWGDIRDGGSRNHEGIDIFAKRGTPVIAPTSGRVGFTGEKGLGGKQVWLRDSKRGQSLYYAHLDSITPNLRSVSPGDTLGFVGNTGNAKTTPPHLHFGIYKSGKGAIDPLGFVYFTEEPKQKELADVKISSRIKVNAQTANFRNKPASNNSSLIKKGKSGEILMVQGKTADWYHVRDSLDRSMFIHESLVQAIN